MGRLLRAIGSLLAYFCIATVLAEVVMVGFAAQRFKLDRGRWMQIFAIAYGIDTAQPKPEADAKPVKTDGEQPSFDETIQRRALKNRNIELREQALRESLDQFRLDQRKLADETRRYKQLRESFETELASLRASATSAGIDDVRRTFETIKPKQAKEQILKMIADEKLDQVVTILSAMPDGKRAKIFGEFKTANEADKLREILRRIRDGAPAVDQVDKTQQALAQPRSSGA